MDEKTMTRTIKLELQLLKKNSKLLKLRTEIIESQFKYIYETTNGEERLKQLNNLLKKIIEDARPLQNEIDRNIKKQVRTEAINDND